MLKPIKEYSSLEEVLIDAIAEEEYAEYWYTQAAELIPDPELRSTLITLAAMEADHALQLKNCLGLAKAQQLVNEGIMSSFGENPFQKETK